MTAQPSFEAMMAQPLTSQMPLAPLVDLLSRVWSGADQGQQIRTIGNLVLVTLVNDSEVDVRIASFQATLTGNPGSLGTCLPDSEATALADWLGTTLWRHLFDNVKRQNRAVLSYDTFMGESPEPGSGQSPVPDAARLAILALMDAGFEFGVIELEFGEPTRRNIYLLLTGATAGMIAKVSWPDPD